MRTRLAVTSSLLLLVGTASCTLVSGVEDYEIRVVVPAPTSTTGAPTSPAASPQGSNEAGAPAVQPPLTGPTSGPKLCGAEGTWMACEPAAVLATCADQCKAKGLTCVDSCCLEDSLGDYPAKIGMAFSLPQLFCSAASIQANTTGGYCTDPQLAAASTGMQVRCCCK